MSTVLEKIKILATKLSLEQQEQALVLIQELAQKQQEVSSTSKLPPGTDGKALLSLHFSMSPEDIALMEEAIEDCERIEPDEDWLHLHFA